MISGGTPAVANPKKRAIGLTPSAFARDVLTKVGPATRGLPTPLARFAATRPFYEQAVAAGFLRRLIPAPLGGEGTGGLDMAVLAEEFHAVDANVSLTLLGTMLGLFPVLLAGNPEQQARFAAPFVTGQGAPLASFCFSEPGGSANFAAPRPAEGVRTVARRANGDDASDWIITGAKKWASSATGWDGRGADLMTVVCRTDPNAPPERAISVIAVTGPAPGVIAVWPHHVGFVVGSMGPGRIRVVSGNHNHLVQESTYSTHSVMAFRYPVGGGGRSMVRVANAAVRPWPF